jgi:hypothetical protein
MARVGLHTARTTNMDPASAAEALCNGLGARAPKLVTLFHSSEMDGSGLNRAMRERLPKGTRLLGATTGGEIDNTGMHRGSAVAAAFDGDFEVGIGLGKGLTDDAIAAGARAIARASEELGVRQQDLDPRKHVACVIDDGFRYKKEELLLGVLDKSPGLTLVGGGAGHTRLDLPDSIGHVHVDGEYATDAVAVALFKTDAPFAALRHHWYEPTGQMIRITKVDETAQRALEIDGKPAADRYAELLGVGIDDLEFGKPRGFIQRPPAMKVGREYFIRAPWKPLPDKSILFTNLVEEGMELELMKLGDPAGAMRRFFTEELPRRVENPSANILFHCGGRAFGAMGLGCAQELSDGFKLAPPSVGFNVHFEMYSGFQINTTLTVLAFGSRNA